MLNGGLKLMRTKLKVKSENNILFQNKCIFLENDMSAFSLKMFFLNKVIPSSYLDFSQTSNYKIGFNFKS